VLIDPEQCKTPISCRLEFECTNNTAEYEALVQGLKKAIDLKVKCLKVFGDSRNNRLTGKKYHSFPITASKIISTRGMESSLLF
jgi:hypothetical protein